MPRLEFNLATDDFTSFTIWGDLTTIGRYHSNLVHIDDPSVSGHHAIITQDGDQWVLRDMDSSNGTRVNGAPVTEAVLNPGDILQFGTVECTFIDEAPIAPNSQDAPLPAIQSPTRTRSRRTMVLGTLLWGCLGTIVVGTGLLTLFFYLTVTGTEREMKAKIGPQLRHAIGMSLVENKQRIFSSIHPVGEATNLRVHEVIFRDKSGSEITDFTKMTAFTVRYTLDWQGPITSDGFTKIEATYDYESQRWINSQLLATNGITTQQFAEGAFMIGIQMALDQ